MSYQKSRYTLLSLILISLFQFGLFGQSGQYRFKHLDVSDGLSQNTVNDIFQDSDGFLWIATQDGLNRYDGYEIVQYLPRRSDSTSISDNFIWNITEDELGYLWVCSRNGVNRLNRQTGEFTKFMSDPKVSPTSIVHHNSQAFVLVGDGIYQIPTTTDRKVYDSLANFPKIAFGETLMPFLMVSGKNRTLTIFTEKGILLLSSEHQELIDYPIGSGPSVTLDNRVAETADGKMIIAVNNGLYRFDPAKKEIVPYLHHLLKGDVHAIAFGPRKNLWVSTDNGIQIIDIPNERILNFNPLGNQSDILKSEEAFAMHSTSNGILWIGTSNSGLFSYDYDQDKFKFLNTQNGLSSTLIWSICQISENEYWLGTEAGVTIIKKKPNSSFTAKTFMDQSVDQLLRLKLAGLENFRVNNIFIDDSGYKWLSVQGQGIWVLNKRNQLLKKINFNQNDPNSNQVSHVVQMGEKYWVTTFNGIYLVNKDYQIERRLEHKQLDTGYFFKATVDAAQNLWFGGNTGFFRYRPLTDELTHFAYDPSKPESPGFYFVNDFAEDSRGNMWLATFGGGFDYFNKISRQYKHFTQEDGLANNVVSSIMTDGRQNVWLGNNKGVSRYNPNDSTIVNFNLGDGIIFEETAINASYQNEDGEMFFGTPGGLIVFHPDSISPSQIVNEPQLTGFLINYNDAQNNINEDEHIDLFPKDKVITFEFASLVFRNAERTDYEFMIEGIDDQWVATDANNRRATYSTLPYGTHKFKVRARDTYGSISAEKQVTIIVHPPLWRTWWFLSLMIIVILLVVLGSVRAYFKRKLAANLREMEVKQRVQAERERISRDLHDNVGSQITHIISSLDNMAYQVQEKKGLQAKLDDLSNFARSTMRFLRETIWIINKDTVSLSEFVDKSNDHGKRMTEDTAVNFSFKLLGKADLELKPSIAMNLFRVFQEGVNNVIKHANAANIMVTLKHLDGTLLLSISDDGIGFNGEEKKGHYGLRNMTDRVKEMNGSLRISSPKKGTVLKAQIPYEKITSNA